MKILLGIMIFIISIDLTAWGSEPGCPSKSVYKKVDWKANWVPLKNIKEADFTNEEHLKFLSGQPEIAAAYYWKKDPKDKKTYLNNNELGKTFFSPPLEFSKCHGFQEGDFTKLVCGHLTNPLAILIYTHKKPLFISFEEYTSPIVELDAKYMKDNDVAYAATVRFKAWTTDYFVIRKASEVQVQACSTVTQPVD